MDTPTTYMHSDQSDQLPPDPASDQPDLMFKNLSTSGSAVISGNGNLIDGSSSYTLESLASVTFRWIGTGWAVVAAY